MNNVRIGDLIKKRRLSLGVSQEDVCEGICAVSTLSKIENGVSVPRKIMLDKLVDKLGIKSDDYYNMVSDEDFDAEDLKYKIIVENASRNFVEANRLLDELEKLPHSKESFYQLFIVRSRIVSAKLTPEKEYDLLIEALRKVCPRFTEDSIGKYLLSIEEVKVIIAIAVTYSRRGDNDKANFIYGQLLNYTKCHFIDTTDVASVKIMIAYNYSKSLALCEEYKKSLEIADIGLEYSKKYNKYGVYGEILTNKAFSQCKRGCILEGKTLYQKATAFFYSLDEIDNMDIVINAAKSKFDLDIKMF